MTPTVPSTRSRFSSLWSRLFNRRRDHRLDCVMRLVTSATVAGLLALTLGCKPTLPDSPVGGPSRSARRLLQIAENEQLPPKRRVEAIAALAKYKEAAVAERLGQLLLSHNQYDNVTGETLWTLAQIGDPVALPYLTKYESSLDGMIPGRLGRCLYLAIEACSPKTEHLPQKE